MNGLTELTLTCAEGRGLEEWAASLAHRPTFVPRGDRLRFAFYGRVSTEDHQDPVTSRARQLAEAAPLVVGHGRIVAEYFDAGQSRVLPWARRPQAAALLAAIADPEREFGAIVVGEYERAFYGDQYSLMAPLFEHYGVELWTPEMGGRVDHQAEQQEQTMLALGWQSKREIMRTKTGSAPPWPPRPASRDATWVAGHRMGTGSPTQVRIRTRPTPRGDGERTGLSRIR